MGTTKQQTREIYRSAITGEIVRKEYAEKHPDTTVKEIIKVKKK
jgi:hypothetical protein